MKSIFKFFIFGGILLSVSAFAEVEHVDAQCPDLNGSFTSPAGEFDVMRVETSRGTGGEFRFGIAFFPDGWISTDPVDGIAKKESDAGSYYRYACNDQKIYLYRVGTNVQTETRWSLNAARNLVVLVIDHGVPNEKVYPRAGQ